MLLTAARLLLFLTAQNEVSIKDVESRIKS